MKISVVIPSYNRANLLGRTIKSVVQQTYKNFEIIIVDDSSMDNTFDVVKLLKEKYTAYEIKYIKHSINKGESGARNTGIRASTGDYIAFLDSDDEWHEQKLDKQINYLNQISNEYDGLICEYYQILNESSRDTAQKEKITFQENYLTADNILLKGCGYSIGSNLILKRDKITEYFDENLKLFADIDWLYRTLLSCKIGILHEPLSYYYKAPMRTGEYVEYHAKILIKKYTYILTNLSFIERRRFYSTVYWYIAVSYNSHNSYKLALFFYGLGLINWPFRRLGNYAHLLFLLFKWLTRKT